MKQKRIIVSVSNDLSSDQRVHKTCMELQAKGHSILLIGRLLPNSLPLERSYDTHRMKLIFKKKIFFYIELQIRLFVFLLFVKADVFWSNDLDTLIPNYYVSKLRRKKLIYDSHEYFCGAPEILSRPKVYKIWKTIENHLFPKLTHALTVNDSIAKLYRDEYGIPMYVMRNISPRPEGVLMLSRQELNLPNDKIIFINQGRGINLDRGGIEMIEALLPYPQCLLLIVGNGNAMDAIRLKIKELQMQDRVILRDAVPYKNLLSYTLAADFGVSLDNPSSPNYYYSLPNKLFDYIHCDLPVLASPVVEVAGIVNHWKIGEVAESYSIANIQNALEKLLAHGKEHYQPNLKKAAAHFTWESEKQRLNDFFKINEL